MPIARPSVTYTGMSELLEPGRIAMRILIIDDCPMARLALRTMLEGVGYTVLEAEDGEQIVRSGRRVQADLVICDMLMPGRDGLAVIRELRRTSPGIKIIAISGGAYQGKMDALRASLSVGADDILEKPIREENLLKTVSWLARKQAKELTAAKT
jgi:CheY-like chemotaxis protein